MYRDWQDLLSGLGLVAVPLGLLLALVVTGHVLLHKRDVAAAIGWIGLVWLAPLWGALFYVMFGINRVARRARRIRRRRPPRHHVGRAPDHDFAEHLKPLERAVKHITGRPAEAGNAVAHYTSGDDAYPVMLAAIAAARSSLALCTYIMRDDAVGQRFVEALAAAHRRGVAVRVLLDGIGSGYFPAIGRLLRRNDLPTALFMHSALPWRMPFLNLRNHKKLLIADGTVGFTGGMNITAACLLAAHPKDPVADTHFRLIGPVVAQLMDAFARDWEFAAGETLEGARWFPDLPDAGPAVARVVTSGPDQDFEKIAFVMLEAIGCARATISLMTPYFLPDERIVTALALAAMRGVAVEIVVPRRSDHRFVDLAMRAHIGPLLECGARVWLAEPPFNHSKLMVVDRHWCLVGSANWDLRSLRLNFELNAEVYSDDLAGILDALMRRYQNETVQAKDLAARSLPVKLRDAGLRLLLPYI